MTMDELARKCLFRLVEHVLAHQGRTLTGITYEDLARRIGFFNKHGAPQPRIGKALGKMGHLLESIDLGWKERIPHIQALVVVKRGKNKEIPDDGIKEFWRGYDQLSRIEKMHKAHAEWKEIADFGSRWNTVLQRLNLGPVEPDLKLPKPAMRFANGGESPQHRALKEHIANNPGVIGVPGVPEVFPEYALPSLDKVDVLFKSTACWTAVEVKSVVSDSVPDDYKRGVYQVVKYAAILDAMRRDPKYLMPDSIMTILVLESSLPPALGTLAATLRIKVFEKVTPPESLAPT
jgi:hypothetical protein